MPRLICQYLRPSLFVLCGFRPPLAGKLYTGTSSSSNKIRSKQEQQIPNIDKFCTFENFPSRIPGSLGRRLTIGQTLQKNIICVYTWDAVFTHCFGCLHHFLTVGGGRA
eukprot:1416572-Amphidinium_carterae.2